MSDTDLTPEELADAVEAEAETTEAGMESPEVETTSVDEVVEQTAVDEEAAAVADAAEDEVAENEVAVDDTPASADEDTDEPEAAADVEQAATPIEEPAADEVEELDVDTADVGDEDELFEEAPVKVESAFDRPGRWYVVHTQSGHEKKAQQNLTARAASMNMEDRIFESVIPMEDVVEFKNGKKVVVQKKMFPGYLLVRAHLDDDAWYVVRNTPSVVNFVGSGGKPSPLLRREVENFLQVKEEGAPATPNKRKTARLEYEMGETVRVKEGPFADFSGEIVEINEDQLKVKVLVNIFGRETPVELEFSQIARL